MSTKIAKPSNESDKMNKTLNSNFQNFGEILSENNISNIPSVGEHWQTVNKLLDDNEELLMNDRFLQLKDEFKKKQMEIDELIEQRRSSERFALQQKYG